MWQVAYRFTDAMRVRRRALLFVQVASQEVLHTKGSLSSSYEALESCIVGSGVTLCNNRL